MDFHNDLYRHSWNLEDGSYWLWWYFDFSASAIIRSNLYDPHLSLWGHMYNHFAYNSSYKIWHLTKFEVSPFCTISRISLHQSFQPSKQIIRQNVSKNQKKLTAADTLKLCLQENKKISLTLIFSHHIDTGSVSAVGFNDAFALTGCSFN